MRLAFVADGHSPIARSWMAYFIDAGAEVHLISTYPCQADARLASMTLAPVAYSGMGDGAGDRRGTGAFGWLRSAAGLGLRVRLRQWLGPLTIRRSAARVRQALLTIQPDLVHALRVPFEGMVAAAANPAAPLLISTWGNDFTFHARSTASMALATRRAMRRADALHADCARDLRLGRAWGFAVDRPTIVLPGNGGVRSEVFHPQARPGEALPEAVRPILEGLPADCPVVVNPRGFRAYVRQDTFFRMMPSVLEQIPATHFLCPAMKDELVAERWVRRLGLQGATHLLPALSPEAMAAVFRRAQVVVSLGVHDGTPNTLLEAMACGCYPVAGDLKSIREWIDPRSMGCWSIRPTRPRSPRPSPGGCPRRGCVRRRGS